MVAWTELEKAELVALVRAGPLTIDWSELAGKFKRKEPTLRRLYNQLVTPAEHVKCCVFSVDLETVSAIVNTEGFDCTGCQCHFFDLKQLIWQKKRYCLECHTVLFASSVQDRWNKVNEWLKHNGKCTCAICGRVAVYNRLTGQRFHLDHLNMFDKTGTVYCLVLDGSDFLLVEKELDKCQVLCTSCHSLVTTVEQRTGFCRLKQRFSRLEMPVDGEITTLYGQFMTGVYAKIRQTLTKKRKASDLI